MDPTTTFCPTMAYPARGPTGQGNLGIHARADFLLRRVYTPCSLPHVLFSLYHTDNSIVCWKCIRWKHHQVSFQPSRLSLLYLA